MKQIEIDDVIMEIDDLLHSKEKEAQHWYDQLASARDDIQEIAKESDEVFLKLERGYVLEKEDYAKLQSLINSARYFWDPNREDRHYE